MKKHVTKILGCFLFAFALSFFTPSVAKASVKNIPKQKSTNIYSGKVDMNGDNKLDSIVIRPTNNKQSDTDYLNHFTVSMNGKTVLRASLKDLYCYTLTVKYAKMSKSREFLQVIGYGESDYVVYNKIFAYNKKTKKFRVVNNLTNSYATSIVSANKKGIVMKHITQPLETGLISWTFPYKYSKEKFVATTKSTKTVKSMIANYNKDKYSKYFAKNKFIAAKKITFYNGKKVAFTVKKGNVVTLTKLAISKNRIQLQFKYGKKTGYIGVNKQGYNFDKPLFMGVNARLGA